MLQPKTEQLHADAAGLDLLDSESILSILHKSQVEAAQSVAAAIPALAAGAEAMAKAIRSGGNLVYAAAGSSGLMGLADGLEIPPTFGISNARITILRAGGLEDMARPKGEVEDDADAAARDAKPIGANDCVICIAASGNTIFPVTIMNIARHKGATTIGISNNADAALLKGSDIPILLPTPPEVIAGSTRLGAGTAQKIALNMMSTLMGVKLGHVLDGMMVNVVANNVKLFARAERIVMQVAKCEPDLAAQSLKAADGSVKDGALIALGARNKSESQRLLSQADQNLRAAISLMKSGQPD